MGQKLPSTLFFSLAGAMDPEPTSGMLTKRIFPKLHSFFLVHSKLSCSMSRLPENRGSDEMCGFRGLLSHNIFLIGLIRAGLGLNMSRPSDLCSSTDSSL